MKKPRIILADNDFTYISPLMSKFVHEFLDEINLEILTDEKHFCDVFEKYQVADALIINESFWNSDIENQEIGYVFVLTEEKDCAKKNHKNICYLYKYTSIKEIFLEIIGKSNLKLPNRENKNTSQIIAVTSAAGGAGKTTVALGIATALSDMYKKVLYIEAAHLHTFQQHMEEKSALIDQEAYTVMAHPESTIYQRLKGKLRKQKFVFFPPLKAALMSLGIKYDIYEMIARGAKESNDYDYIVIDMDVVFDEQKARLIQLSDKVIIVSENTGSSIFSTNCFIKNINNIDSGKYLFVCNKYEKDEHKSKSVLEGPDYRIDEYIEFFNEYEEMNCESLGKNNSIRKIAFLLV